MMTVMLLLLWLVIGVSDWVLCASSKAHRSKEVLSLEDNEQEREVGKMRCHK